VATVFSHGLVALALGRVTTKSSMPARFWSLFILCSILPDADVAGFAVGIQYGDLLGHRGLTHSLSFALVLSLLVVRQWFREATTWTQQWWFLNVRFFLITASHGLLDAMTDGGLGVAFLSPFDNTRYFLPWRPIKVSPIGLTAVLNPYMIDVLLSEVVWIWMPAGLLVLGVLAYRKRRRSAKHI
jgi:inner membrane protein